MKKLLAAIVFALMLAPTASYADGKSKGPRFDISATVSKTVKQDEIYGSLYFRAENADVASVQQTINVKMKEAWALASNAKDVSAQVTGYRVWFDDGIRRAGYEKDVEPRWIGQQSISLKGKNDAAVKDLIKTLQGMGFAISGIGYQVSAELREQTQEDLMPAAAEKLLDKGRKLAAAFGSTLKRLKEITLGGQGPVYAQRAAMMEAAAPSGGQMEAPVAEPIEEEISLTISASALMGPVSLEQ